MDLSPATTGPAGATSGPQQQAGPAPLSSDFETFLKMLTVQMQNQDPLNPLESTDFAVQLATFSGVEQQVRTNDLLQSLAGGGLSRLTEIAPWVGMEARAPVPARFDGAPVTAWIAPPEGADRLTLVVRDMSGGEVARLAVAPDARQVDWPGTDAWGAPAPAGQYRFDLLAWEGDQPLVADPPEVFAGVAEVRMEGADPVVIFAGGTALAADKVTALRAPV